MGIQNLNLEFRGGGVTYTCMTDSEESCLVIYCNNDEILYQGGSLHQGFNFLWTYATIWQLKYFVKLLLSVCVSSELSGLLLIHSYLLYVTTYFIITSYFVFILVYWVTFMKFNFLPQLSLQMYAMRNAHIPFVCISPSGKNKLKLLSDSVLIKTISFTCIFFVEWRTVRILEALWVTKHWETQFPKLGKAHVSIVMNCKMLN